MRVLEVVGLGPEVCWVSSQGVERRQVGINENCLLLPTLVKSFVACQGVERCEQNKGKEPWRNGPGRSS